MNKIKKAGFKTHSIIRILQIIVAIFFIFVAAGTAFSEQVFDSAEEKKISIIDLDEGLLQYKYRVADDLELRGVQGTGKWFFDVDEDIVITDFKFNLTSRISELIIKESSHLVIYMNNIPVRAISMLEVDESNIEEWEVYIPAELIEPGYNELKVITHTIISYIPCQSDKHPGNWVIIDGDSSFTYTFFKKTLNYTISDFPKPFIGIYADNAPGIGVVIPDTFTDNELSAALTLIARLKTYQLGYQVNVTLVTGEDVYKHNFNSIIYVGSYNNMPYFLREIRTIEDEPLSDYVYLEKAKMVDQIVSGLLIYAEDDKHLITGVNMLFNKELKEQLIFRQYALSTETDIFINEEIDDNLIYLSDLGLNGILLEGIEKQVANIGLMIPVNEVLAVNSSVNLNIRYSDNLDFEKSVVSVFINNIPIGSEVLEKEKRDLHEITMHIPEELRTNSYYDIRIVFELVPSGDISCERYLHSMPWAYIQEDTSLYFPKIERRLFLFQSLPYPFTMNNDLSDTVIIMPDNPTNDDLIVAGKISEFLGVSVNNNVGMIKAIKGDMFHDRHKSMNLILYGNPENNSVIRNVNEYLWFRYDERYNTILSNEKLELLPETAQTAAFIELKSSPYDEQLGMMTLTSNDNHSLFNAVSVFSDDKRFFLVGDAAVISKSGEILTMRFQKEPEPERPAIRPFDDSGSNVLDYLYFASVLLLFLGVGLMFYLYKNRKSIFKKIN